MAVQAKDPDSDLDYSVDWTDWLAAGEVINSVNWSVFPIEVGGLAKGGEVGTGNIKGIMLSGGVVGHEYRVTCRITTDQNRTDDRAVTIRVQHR